MLTIDVEGMTCSHCVRAITEAVSAVPGAAEVQVDLATGHVRVGGLPDAGAVRQAIEAEGYAVRASQA